MIINDLEKANESFRVEIPVVTDPVDVGEIVGQREDIAAISAQIDIEERFNNPIELDINVLPAEVIADPVEPPRVGEFKGLEAVEAFQDIIFVVGYTSRLIRSALAITGLTAGALSYLILADAGAGE